MKTMTPKFAIDESSQPTRNTPRPSRRHSLPFLALLLGLFTLGSCHAAQAGNTYWASPEGSANPDNTPQNPDTLADALAKTSPGNGDTVNVLSSPTPYIVSSALDVNPGVTIQGVNADGNRVDGNDRPLIKTDTNFGSTLEEAVHIDDFFGAQYFYNNYLTRKDSNGNETAATATIEQDRDYNPGIFNVTRVEGNEFRSLRFDGSRFDDRDCKVAAAIIVRAVNAYGDGNNQPGGNTTVDNCDFRDIQGAGVFFFGGSNYFVTNSTFEDTGFAEGVYQDTNEPPGIIVPGADNQHASSGAVTLQKVQTVTVRGNVFTSRSYFSSPSGYPAGFGVKTSQGEGVNYTIDANEFNLSQFSALNKGTSNFDIELFFTNGTFLVTNNRFHNTVSVVGAPNTTFRNNIWTDINRLGGSDFGIELFSDNCTIENNYFDATIDPNATPNDNSFDNERSGGQFIEKNGTGITANATIRRNVVVNAGTFIKGSGVYTNLKVYNNTALLAPSQNLSGNVVGPASFISHSQNVDNNGISGEQDLDRDWLIVNNIISQANGDTGTVFDFDSVIGSITNFTATNNLLNRVSLFSNPDGVSLPNSTVDSNAFGDPQFQFAGGPQDAFPYSASYFAPLSSLAIDQGTDGGLGLSFNDLAPDIGAVETGG